MTVEKDSFFVRGLTLPITVREIAEYIGAVVYGDGSTAVSCIAPLQSAGSDALSFLSNRRYAKFLPATTAAAVILQEDDREQCPCVSIVLDNPYLGYARAAQLLSGDAVHSGGVHDSATVAPDASVDPTAYIGPNAVIESGARVGARTRIGPNCVLAEDARVGADGELVASVFLGKGTTVGDRTLLHPGVVVGADGFGIAKDGERWIKVPQIGSVCLGDDVEVGANTTIDRGALEDTVIGHGVKIDNLVQIGHNVQIGDHTAIAGCVGIAGSARIGAGCTIGGAASIGGHLEIVDDVHLTGTAAVANSILEPGIYSSGMPAQDNRSWRRMVARLGQLDSMAKRLRALERARGDETESES